MCRKRPDPYIIRARIAKKEYFLKRWPKKVFQQDLEIYSGGSGGRSNAGRRGRKTGVPHIPKE